MTRKEDCYIVETPVGPHLPGEYIEITPYHEKVGVNVALLLDDGVIRPPIKEDELGDRKPEPMRLPSVSMPQEYHEYISRGRSSEKDLREAKAEARKEAQAEAKAEAQAAQAANASGNQGGK